MIYLHDGNFDGFLTCVYEHYYSRKVEEIYCKDSFQPKLFEEIRFVETDKNKADKVYASIMKRFSKEIYWDIFSAFLSKNVLKDCYLLKFLETAFKMGNQIEGIYTHKDTIQIKKLSRLVNRERHRFLGLLRFSDTGKVLFSKINPDNDILILIAEHFSNRLKNERFIIYDEVRRKAVISNNGDWFITDADLKEEALQSKEEKFFQELWKEYFQTIGIEGRKNLRLQQNFVPLKYRKNIIEFN